MTAPRLAFSVAATAFVVLAFTSTLLLAQEKRKLDPIAKDSGFAWIAGDDSIPHEIERSTVHRGLKADDPRDMIPPIDDPEFYLLADDAVTDLGLRDDDRVLGIEIDGVVKCYPTRILDRHEIANDYVAGRPIAAVW